MTIGEGVGLLADLEACLQERRNKGTIRSLPKATSWASGLIDFSSNDYLSLARSETLQKEIASETKSQCESGHPLGSTGSRLLTGNSSYYELIEQEIAQYHNGESALLFNSGYALNIGFFGSVPMAKHTVFYDELIHNSVREGMKLCRAKCVPFRHNSVDDLRKQLESCPPHTAIVAVESVYSMDGDCAPIREMCEVCELYGAALVVDEAHSLGLYGPQGIGLVSQFQLEKRVFCTMNPFGKSLGTQGGVIIGPAVLREYLVNYARSFIYSTAMPVSTLAAIRCGYRHMIAAHDARKTLMGHIALFRELIAKVPVSRIESDSAIQVVIVAGNEQVTNASKALLAAGYHVLPIKSPTVTAGQERLRIVLHAHNKEEEVRGLVDAIARVVATSS